MKGNNFLQNSRQRFGTTGFVGYILLDIVYTSTKQQATIQSARIFSLFVVAIHLNINMKNNKFLKNSRRRFKVRDSENILY